MVNLVWFTLLVKFESWCWRKSNSVPKTTFFERKLSWIWLTVSKTRMSDFKKNDFDFRNISNNALPLSKWTQTGPDFLQNPDNSLVKLKNFNLRILLWRFSSSENWPVSYKARNGHSNWPASKGYGLIEFRSNLLKDLFSNNVHFNRKPKFFVSENDRSCSS